MMAQARYPQCTKWRQRKQYKRFIICLANHIVRDKRKISKKRKKKMLIFLIFLNEKHKWLKSKKSKQWLKKYIHNKIKQLERTQK